MPQSDKPRQLEPGEWLHEAIHGRSSNFAGWAPCMRATYARAEAACIAKGRQDVWDALEDAVAERNEALSALQAATPRWIPTSERLPEIGTTVVFLSVGRARVGYLQDVRSGLAWLYEGGNDWPRMVTHWMPLPACPSEETT